MVREFKEETGVETDRDNWYKLGVMISTLPKTEVYYFKMFNQEAFNFAKAQDEAEPLERFDTNSFLDSLLTRLDILPDLYWILPMIGLDHSLRGCNPFIIPFSMFSIVQQCRQRQQLLGIAEETDG